MRRSLLRRAALPIGVALLVAALVFPLAYRFDNKYTHAGPEAIGGVLYLDGADAGRVHYLTRDWEFYPGALLSPADFTTPDAPSPERYVFIGQHSTLNLGGPGGAYGQGTYRLNILLPEEMHSYTLLMPEVYSASRLYVNGTLLLALGEPAEANYRASMSTKLVTFDAGGRVEIVLAVGSRGHLYNGLTHPPAFGPSGAVIIRESVHLIVWGSVTVLGAFLGLMFLYMRLAAGYKNGLLFALQCLCMLQYAAQPLLRTWTAFGVQPWSTLYLLGYYGTFWVMLMLQSSLWGLDRRYRPLVVAPGAVMCGLVLLLPLVLRVAPGAAPWFSFLSDVYKWALAAAMLAGALYATWRGLRFSLAVLGVSAFFAFALVFDRLLPLFEPIYTGWFIEVAGVVVTLVMGGVMWTDMVRAMRAELVYNEALRRAEGNLEMQRRHYRLLDEQIAATRAAHHDLRQQMVVLQGFADGGDLEGLRGHLDQMGQAVPSPVQMQFTENHAVNIITRYYAGVCRDEGVAFSANWQIPSKWDIPDSDISVVLGNLLENAAEAASHTGEGWVKVDGKASNLKLMLVVTNSFAGPLRPKRGGLFASTKTQGGGQGLASVLATAERRGGTAFYEARAAEGTRGVFTARVILPLGQGHPVQR